MQHLSMIQLLFLIVLFLLLIIFSFLGYKAMRPESRQSDINTFWLSIMLFLVVLALYLAIYVSSFLAVAPLIPLFIFIRIFFATQKNKKQ